MTAAKLKGYIIEHVGVSKKKIFTWNQSWFFNYNVLKIPDSIANQ